MRREFGNFADGTIDGELDDASWNWWPPHVTLVEGPNGGHAALLVADDSMDFENQGDLVRVHGIAFAGGNPDWFGNERECWRAVSLLVPRGYSNATMPTVDEVHGDNGTGPAPLNTTFERDDVWSLFVRGSEFPQANPPGGYPFEQNLLGGHAGGTYEDTYYRRQLDWVGGTKEVVLDEWLDLRLGWFFSTDPERGWFHGFARWPGLDGWREIVPRLRGIRTSYPDVSGEGEPIYPMLSLYYNQGSGDENAIAIGGGCWFDNYAECCGWQDKRLGYDGSAPLPPLTPTTRVTCSIQSGGELPAGEVVEVSSEVTGTPPARISYLFDGVVYGEATAAPWQATLDLSAVEAGAHTHGLIAYDAQGLVIPSANYPSYPVIVSPSPLPPDETLAQRVDDLERELALTNADVLALEQQVGALRAQMAAIGTIAGSGRRHPTRRRIP
jgi:hypothetical protein